ncbi:MAG: hypothetical protein P8020_16815 [Acidobacteriota bacterium]
MAAIIILGAIYPYLIYSLTVPESPSLWGGSVAAQILAILLLCAAVLSVLLSFVVFQAWKQRFFTSPARIYFTAVSAAVLASSLLWLDFVGFL